MARVLVLSRNAAIAMGLATADLDVIDRRPDSSDRWLDALADDVDVVVVQPDATYDAATAIGKLRSSSCGARALLIAPQSAAWPDPAEAAELGVERLDLPVSLTSLLSEVTRLAALPAFSTPTTGNHHSPAPTVALVEPDLDPIDDQADDEFEDQFEDQFDDEATREPDDEGPLSVAGGAEDESSVPLEDAASASPPDPPEASAQPARANELDEEPQLGDALVEPTLVATTAMPSPDPLTAPFETLVVGAPSQWLYGQWLAADYIHPQQTAIPEQMSEAPTVEPPAAVSPAPADPPAQPRAELPGDHDIERLAEALLARRAQLTSLAEISDVVVSECISLTGSDAGALLCLDEGVWRVSAGTGLRPLEHRLQLEPTHWLVRTLHDDRKAVVVEHTDIAREQLHGAPLASWEHLAAVPFEGVDVFVLVARHDQPYTSDGVERILGVADEAAGMLREALTLRALARTLAPYVDSTE